MSDYIVIEAIDQEYAICEQPDRTRVRLPRTLLPADAKVGDCLRPTEDGSYVPDAQLTAERRTRSIELTKKLFG